MIHLIERRGIIIAVISALLASLLVVIWLKQRERNLKQEAVRSAEAIQANKIEAIFAKADIPQGKVITEDMVYVRQVFKDSLPPGSATSLVRVVDRIATQAIKKDSIVPIDKVAWPTTEETTLSSKTPVGKRAITIQVDNIASLVGMIKPNDYVDVIGLIPIPVQVGGKQGAQPATVPLFQNVLVLAVGSQVGTPTGAQAARRASQPQALSKETAPLITLALNPEETNLLAFVQEQGKIRLVLRSPGDANTQPVAPVGWDTLLKYLFPNMDLNPQEEKQEPLKEVPKVEVIRGLKKEMVPLSQK